MLPVKLSSCCSCLFQPTVRLFLPRERSEMLRHFALTTKIIPRYSWLTVLSSGSFAAQLTSFFTYRLANQKRKNILNE